MSNYVNNVKVGDTTYTLGPLASTASGGIVDNVAGSYSSYNNCIIHAGVHTSNSSEFDGNLILNTDVNVGQYATLNNTTIIGGGGMSLVGAGSFPYTAFINCDTSIGSGVSCCSTSGDTFIGLYGCSNSSFNTYMLLRGINNIVQGYAYCTDAGFHAVATKTIDLQSNYGNSTGIYFPVTNCCGMYTITVLNSTVYDKFDFVVKSGEIQPTSNTYWSGTYLYCSATNSIGIKLYNASLSLYTSYGYGGPTQVTLSYDVIPYFSYEET